MSNLHSSRTITLLLTAAVVGAAAGSGITYELTKSDNKKESPKQVSQVVPTSITPDKSKENTVIPVDVISRDFKKYLGLKLVALGKLSKTDNNSGYILASSNGKTSIAVDTSDLNGKQDEYLNQQVKLTGIIKFIDIGNQHYSLGIRAASLNTN